MVKLSIVIPYYETYELTKKLLDSLVPQCNKEVEIILLDDGCNEQAFDDYIVLRSFDNLRIVHQDNIGVAKSRNKGIDLAKGKYVGFIDCDDLVTPDYIDVLLEAIDKYDTDIINFNWVNINTNAIIRKPSNPAPWKAIYKKEKINKFREDMSYGTEDLDFQAEIKEGIATGKYSITYLDRLLYIYNSNREGSLTWKKEREL